MLVLCVVLITIAGTLFEERGVILTIILLVYALTSIVGGAASGSHYSRSDGKVLSDPLPFPPHPFPSNDTLCERSCVIRMSEHSSPQPRNTPASECAAYALAAIPQQASTLVFCRCSAVTGLPSACFEGAAPRLLRGPLGPPGWVI